MSKKEKLIESIEVLLEVLDDTGENLDPATGEELDCVKNVREALEDLQTL